MKKSHQNKLTKMREKLADMREAIDEMAVEYADKYNLASQKWQDSAAGEECDNAREQLETAAADVESAESALADLCA